MLYTYLSTHTDLEKRKIKGENNNNLVAPNQLDGNCAK